MKKLHAIFLVCAASAMFCTVFVGLQLFTNIHHTDYIATDSYTYMEAGKLLYTEGKPHPTRPYLSGAILGLPYLFNSNASIHSVVNFNLLLNLALWFSTILLVYKTVLLFASQKLAFYTCLAYLFCVGAIGFVGLILTETLSAFMMTGAVYLGFRFEKTSQIGSLLGAISIMLLLVLVKPGMVYWSLLLAVLGISFFVKSRKLSIKFTIPIVASLGLIFIQAQQVDAHYGKFGVSLIDKITWFNYLGAEVEAENSGRSLQEVKRERMEVWEHCSWQEITEIGSADMKHNLQENPVSVLKLFALNISNNAIGKSAGLAAAKDYKQSSFFSPLQKALLLLSMAQNFLFVLGSVFLGLWILKGHYLNVATFLAIGTIAYIIFTSGITFKQGDRFNVVFYPVTLMLLSYLLVKSGITKRLNLTD